MFLDLTPLQIIFIGLIFIWSGFVRSGLGFGGAVLSLPFLLLVDNRPIVYLPIIAVHLLFFSCLAVLPNLIKHRNKPKNSDTDSSIDWPYLRHAMTVMIIPKIIGVFGLLSLPTNIMTGIIFGIVIVYAMSYILQRPFKSNNRKLDTVFLMLGGYVSGTSLIGAPLIVAVFAQHVVKEKLRDTLFVLWFILVTIKMGTFIYFGVELQLLSHLWLLPCAGLGHWLGLKLHQRLVTAETPTFFRILGVILLIVSSLGIGLSFFG